MSDSKSNQEESESESPDSGLPMSPARSTAILPPPGSNPPASIDLEEGALDEAPLPPPITSRSVGEATRSHARLPSSKQHVVTIEFRDALELESRPPGAIRFETLAELQEATTSDRPVPSQGFGRRNSILPSAATREAISGVVTSPSPDSIRVRTVPPGFVIPLDETHGGPLRTLQATFAAFREVEFDQVLRQMDLLGLRSFGFIGLVLGFVGCILVYQAGIQAIRIVPDTSTIGPSYIEILVRDLAASLTAMMLATRVGAGIAAELGSMRVTDQLDAFRLSRAEPVLFLVAPRVLASLVMTPVLTIFGGVVALITGTLTGVWAFGINPNVFLDPKFVDTADVLSGVAKSIAFGLAIPVLSAHAGLYAKGGSSGVGNATTRAVVTSSLAVIVLGFLIGAGVETLAATRVD